MKSVKFDNAITIWYSEKAMAIEIKSPDNLPQMRLDGKSEKFSIFLGGSIEQDMAKPWQKRVTTAFKNEDVLLLNPRRTEWDSTWKNVKTNKNFKEQVEWELKALAMAHIVLIYFDPTTKSPISLLETGLYARSGKLVVVCPSGFWRKGNVDIVCDWFGIKQCKNLKIAVKCIKDYHIKSVLYCIE